MRNVISKFVMVVMVVGSVACVPGAGPIRIVGAHPVDVGMSGTECGFDSDITIGGGSLDAQGGGDFVMILEVDSELNSQAEIQSNRGITLTGPGKRNFVVDTLLLNYRSTNPVIQFETESIPTYLELRPGTLDNRLLVDIIGDKAAADLRTLTDPARMTQLIVSVQLRGRTESGEAGASNTMSFPLTVTVPTTPCPEPGNVSFTGPCGSRGGQGGTTYTCCMAGTMLPDCPL